MKILLYGKLHHKNEKGLQLLKNKIEIITLENLNELARYESKDTILICGNSFHDINFKNVIFGPQIDLNTIINYCNNNKNKNIKINLLSDWNKNLTKKFIGESEAKLITLPFPVDIEKFKPSIKDERCFIYFKNVHSLKLEIAKSLVKNFVYKIFIYGQYDEEDYLDWISKAKFGIWVGCHESQGFALQEALSCDCPLFVLNAKSLKDECYPNGYTPWNNNVLSYDNLEASTVTYFDETCGIVVDDYNDIENKFKIFLENKEEYKPRNFVENNLSVDNFIENLKMELI